MLGCWATGVLWSVGAGRRQPVHATHTLGSRTATTPPTPPSSDPVSRGSPAAGGRDGPPDRPPRDTLRAENKQGPFSGPETGKRALSVEVRGFEPLTFCMPCRRATNCAIPPRRWFRPSVSVRRTELRLYTMNGAERQSSPAGPATALFRGPGQLSGSRPGLLLPRAQPAGPPPRQECQSQPQRGQRRPQERRGPVAQPGGDDGGAERGAQCVGDVQGRVVQGCGQ